eukprot:scaffold29313_cov146-Isochrysis_galbana.AAC.1
MHALRRAAVMASRSPPVPLARRASGSHCSRRQRWLSSAAERASSTPATPEGMPPPPSGLGAWMRRRRPIPVLGQLSPSEVCGHAAFFLSGTAFLEPEILQLRVLSVFAGGATLVFTYFHPIGSPLWLPFRWNVVFMLINSIYIYRILSEREHADRLPPQALELWERTFAPHGLSR